MYDQEKQSDVLLIINHRQEGPHSSSLLSYCIRRVRLPGAPRSSSMKYRVHLYIWEKEVLKYIRFSSTLMVPADRCSKCWLPGLVSSLYSRWLTHPHYITIRLPLKVILLEHNRTQSKAQTSYIKELVNSFGVYFLLPQKCFQSIHKLELGWLDLRPNAATVTQKNQFVDEESNFLLMQKS